MPLFSLSHQLSFVELRQCEGLYDFSQLLMCHLNDRPFDASLYAKNRWFSGIGQIPPVCGYNPNFPFVKRPGRGNFRFLKFSRVWAYYPTLQTCFFMPIEGIQKLAVSSPP